MSSMIFVQFTFKFSPPTPMAIQLETFFKEMLRFFGI